MIRETLIFLHFVSCLGFGWFVTITAIDKTVKVENCDCLY